MRALKHSGLYLFFATLAACGSEQLPDLNKASPLTAEGEHANPNQLLEVNREILQLREQANLGCATSGSGAQVGPSANTSGTRVVLTHLV